MPVVGLPPPLFQTVQVSVYRYYTCHTSQDAHYLPCVASQSAHNSPGKASMRLFNFHPFLQWMETDVLASHGTSHADFNHPSSTMNGRGPGGHAYTVYTWNDNTGNEVEEYWRIHGMGHAWSGGGPYHFTGLQGPRASLAMYTFFIDRPNHDGCAGEAKSALFDTQRCTRVHLWVSNN
jgi:hypothetical protein